MKIHFLEANVPLTKGYIRTAGELVKTPYPHVTDVTSHDIDVADLKTLEAEMRVHAALGHCLLKGELSRPLVKESRAGTTDTNGATTWIVLDVDGVPTPTIDGLLDDIGLKDVSYILQWSASYGIESKALRCHVIMQLDKPHAAPLLKQWLIAKNFESSILEKNLRLTKTGNAISWPLDITTCQNDKLIYIAAPTLRGIKDPLGTAPRITYVRKSKAKLTIDMTSISLPKNQARAGKALNDLRAAAGLPARKTVLKMHGAIEVMAKPDACMITGIKAERGFIYLNLNGGDSWGYFHPETNPDFIYNFKGEPVYLTKELLPDYWTELHSKQATNKPNIGVADSTGVMRLAFLDPASDKYWRGTYSTATDVLSLNETSSLTTLRMYAAANGIIFQDDIVPEWNLVFNPHDNVRVDPTNMVINQFQPSKYMQAVAKATPTCPKTIRKVIHHALGSDDECFDRFINWLAHVLQNRDVAITAWIMHGIPGTGKGTLLNRILRPLFGEGNIAIPRMQELDKEFNVFIDRKLLVVVDEFEGAALQNEKGVMSDLKRYISEPRIQLRAMHRVGREVRNYTCWIFYSNESAPVHVPRNDRRFNVAKFQPEMLEITDQELGRIEKELQAFHDFLLYHPIVKADVITPMQSQDRDNLIDLTETAVDTVVNALTEGNMGFLVDQLPTDSRYSGDMQKVIQVNDYRSVVADLLARTDRNTGKCNIARDELMVIFRYTTGKIPDTPNKFTSMLKHHRVIMGKVRIGDKSHVGRAFVWTDLAQWPDYLKTLAPPAVAAKKVAARSLVRVK